MGGQIVELQVEDIGFVADEGVLGADATFDGGRHRVEQVIGDLNAAGLPDACVIGNVDQRNLVRRQRPDTHVVVVAVVGAGDVVVHGAAGGVGGAQCMLAHVARQPGGAADLVDDLDRARLALDLEIMGRDEVGIVPDELELGRRLLGVDRAGRDAVVAAAALLEGAVATIGMLESARGRIVVAGVEAGRLDHAHGVTATAHEGEQAVKLLF